MVYSDLVTAVQDYTENVPPTTDMNTFIRQAEQRIYNSIQFPSLRKNVTGATTASNQYMSTPTDFLAPYSFAVVDTTGNYSYLLNKDVNFIREAYPGPTSTGIPRFYALFGPTTTVNSSGVVVPTNELSFILGPTPDIAYVVELHYYYYPTSIVDSSDGHTWLGDNFDSVLFYGTLVEAYTYMKGEADMLSFYDNKYKEALALAKRLGDGMERMDAFRSGQFRQPVV